MFARITRLRPVVHRRQEAQTLAHDLMAVALRYGGSILQGCSTSVDEDGWLTLVAIWSTAGAADDAMRQEDYCLAARRLASISEGPPVSEEIDLVAGVRRERPGCLTL